MKKYASLLLFALMLNGCDDGDLTVETFDFTDVSPQSCSDTYELIYKIKDQESLLLQMPENTLKNEASTVPEVFDINNTTFKVVYRAYDGTLSTSNICDAIRPSTPNISNEWYAVGGTIEITTKANVIPNTTTGASSITGYTHTIVLKNVTYSKPAGEQVGPPTFVFGDFITPEDALSLTFKEAVAQCTTSGQIYNFNAGAGTSITLDNIDSGLIANTITPPNSPRTALISTTKNKLVYKVFDGLISESYFCGTTIPTSPVVTETWNGVDGVSGESGIIEVTTTTLGPTAFKHVIVLKNAILSNGNVSFKLGTNFVLGELTTSTN